MKTLTLSLELPGISPAVEREPTRVRQILENLVSNPVITRKPQRHDASGRGS